MAIDPPPHLVDNDRFNAEVAAFAAAFDPLRAELADRASLSDGGSIFPIDTYELLAVGPLGDAVGDAVVDGATEARILAGGIDDDERLERTVRSSLSTLGEWGPSLRAQVASAAATAEPGAIAAAVLALFSADRVATNATDLVLGGWNYGQVTQYGSVDGLWKRWQTMEDAHVRPAHVEVNHQTVPAEGKFNMRGYLCDGPGDPVLPIRFTVRCRCWTVPAEAPTGVAMPPSVDGMSKAQLAAAITRLGGSVPAGASKPALIAAAFALVDDVVLAEASRRTLLRMAAVAGIEGRHLMATADLRATLAVAAGVTLAASAGLTPGAVLADLRARAVSPSTRSHLGTLTPVTDTLDVSPSAAAAFVDGAGDVGDGSMIALVPTAEDADRLAVEGGLPPEDMHVTLAFLGPATDWDDDARQACIDAVTGLAADRGALDARLWATAVFNGGNDDHDTAHVLLVEDEDLPGFYDAAVDIGARTGPMPEQHPVFTPHLTLIYSDDEHDFSDRLGEVTFDRIRVAFGDDITDIDLGENAADDAPDEGEPTEDEPSDDPEGDDDMATAPMTVKVDTEAVAQRILAEIEADPARFGLPLTQPASIEREGVTLTFGAIGDSTDTVWTTETSTSGTVTLADEDGDGIDDDTGEPVADDEPMAITTDAAGAWQGMIVPEDVESGDGRKIQTGALTHRELPLPLTVSFRNPHGGGEDWASEICGRIDTLERREDGTWWATGVFDLNGDAGREAHRLAAEGFMRGVSVDLDRVIVEYENPEPDPDAPIEEWMDWDPGLFIFTAGRIMGAAFLAHPAFEEAFLELVDPAVVASAGEDAYQPEARLHLPMPAPVDPDAVVASGAAATAQIVETPPAEWFTLPDFDSLMPVRITPEGRISGHVAPFGTCHISFSDRCQPAPSSPSSYGNFRVGQTLTAEGTLVATGPVVIDTVHPDLKLSASDAMAWYAHTGCAVADVAVYEDSHGIVIAGAVRPDITPAQLRSLRGCQPSPDWRAVDGRLDMVALLGVNTSGFIVRAPDEDLSPFALAASGAPSLRARAAFAYATGEPVSMVFDHRPQSKLAAAMSEMRAELAEMRELLRPMRATRARHLASEIAARPRFAVTPSEDDGVEPVVETPDAVEPVPAG